jgi:hypothetical protein
MEGLVILGLIVVALAALDFSALRWGADSRIGFDEHGERTSFRSI